MTFAVHGSIMRKAVPQIMRPPWLGKSMPFLSYHDGVIKRQHFPRYWPCVRDFNGDRWIPLTKASDAELGFFLWYAPGQTVKQTIETPMIWDAPSRPLWSYCNFILYSYHRYDTRLSCIVSHALSNIVNWTQHCVFSLSIDAHLIWNWIIIAASTACDCST